MAARCVTALLLLVLSAAAASAISTAPDPRAVTLLQLRADPEKYRDKEVILYAFLVFQFEESSLYSSKAAAEHMDAAQELPLLGTGGLEDMNGKLVKVHAVFRATPNFPTGYLDSVKAIVVPAKVREF